jgi:hypothetical protein
MAKDEQKDIDAVVPSLNKEDEGKSVQEEKAPSNVKLTKEDVAPAATKYVTIADFEVELAPVEKLWKSRGKKITVMPLTKGDRDKALRPINGQKIEAQSDGSTRGFFISLELFDVIKQEIVCASLKHYADKVGNAVMTKEKLLSMDNKSYEELAEICLSVNKIDFFDTGSSDVGAAAEVKN